MTVVDDRIIITLVIIVCIRMNRAIMGAFEQG